MARSNLTITSVTPAGANHGAQTPNITDGNEIVFTASKLMIIVTNNCSSGEDIICTAVSSQSVSEPNFGSLAVADIPYTIAAGASKCFGCHSSNFNSAGKLNLDWAWADDQNEGSQSDIDVYVYKAV